MDGDEFLETSHSPESEHRSLSSSKRQLAVLGPIVEPPPDFLGILVPDNLHCGPIGLQPVRYDHMRLPISLHRLAQKLQCSMAIPALGDIGFQHLTFVID